MYDFFRLFIRDESFEEILMNNKIQASLLEKNSQLTETLLKIISVLTVENIRLRKKADKYLETSEVVSEINFLRLSVQSLGDKLLDKKAKLRRAAAIIDFLKQNDHGENV